MRVLVILGFACALTNAPAIAQTPPSKPASQKPVAQVELEDRFSTEPITVTATVEAVDCTNRTVVLRGEDGTEQTFKVDESVKKLQNVKAGDVVKMTYYASVATNILKKGDPPPAVGTTGAITPNQESTKPAGTISAQSARVTSRMPNGSPICWRTASSAAVSSRPRRYRRSGISRGRGSNSCARSPSILSGSRRRSTPPT